MRTTLTLDDDVYEQVSRQAKLRGTSLGRTASDLIRRGLNAPAEVERTRSGLVRFRLPADSPTVTTADIRRLEAEGA